MAKKGGMKPKLNRAELATLPDAVNITVPEAALAATVIPATVELWLKNGLLPKRKVGPGKRSRVVIRLGDLRNFIRQV